MKMKPLTNLRLTVKHVLRRALLEARLPHEADAVGVRGRVGILVVGGDKQLREDGGPVHGGDDPVPGPPLVVEEPVEGDVDARLPVGWATGVARSSAAIAALQFAHFLPFETFPSDICCTTGVPSSPMTTFTPDSAFPVIESM